MADLTYIYTDVASWPHINYPMMHEEPRVKQQSTEINWIKEQSNEIQSTFYVLFLVLVLVSGVILYVLYLAACLDSNPLPRWPCANHWATPYPQYPNKSALRRNFLSLKSKFTLSIVWYLHYLKKIPVSGGQKMAIFEKYKILVL